MSTPINPVSIDPTVINSLGASTNYSSVVSLLDQSLISGSADSFTNFYNALGTLVPPSFTVQGTYTATRSRASDDADGGPSTYSDGTTSLNYAPISYGTALDRYTGTVQTTINTSSVPSLSSANLISGFLAQYSINHQFTNDTSLGGTYLATFVAQFQAYVQNAFTLYAQNNSFSSLSNLVSSNLSNNHMTQVGSLTYGANNHSGTVAPTTPSATNVTTLQTALQTDLNSSSVLGGNSTIDSIWSNSSTQNGSSGEALTWFSSFLQNYQYPATGNVSQATFTAQMNAQATQNLLTALLTGFSSGQLPAGLSPYLLQYQTVYNSLFPNTNSTTQTTNFTNALTAFYRSETQKYGPYITPSQAFGDFVASMRTQYLSSLPSDFTSLSTQDANKTLILNNIYALIASMVNSIQEVAAAQSTRLVILTNWQQAYSTELTQIPTFLAANYGYLDGSIRTELNGNFNQTKLTNLQTQQSLVSDDAKALQSNINQSNDAVSQQANMAQSLLQELNTILSSIFK